MAADITRFSDLITSQHSDKPKFMASLAAALQPYGDLIATLQSIPGLYDLDVAIGPRLDVVGEWVGRPRALGLPLTDVYFTLDEAGLGFDEGVWLGPFDPISGLVDLPDESYRTYLRAVIAANHWDGSIPEAYAVWHKLFDAAGSRVLIQDNGDMTMLIALVGSTPDAITRALLTGGYLSLKPSGVRIAGYVGPSDPAAPLFGLDADTPSITGFDAGCWAQPLT